MTDLSELALGHSVPVEDDPGGFVSSGLVELDEELTYHGGQVLNHFLARPLHPHGGTIPAGVGVHTAYHLQRGKKKHEETKRQEDVEGR